MPCYDTAEHNIAESPPSQEHMLFQFLQCTLAACAPTMGCLWTLKIQMASKFVSLVSLVTGAWGFADPARPRWPEPAR
jgi:hypothetical protein